MPDVAQHGRAKYLRARNRANSGRPRQRVYASILAPDPLWCGLCGYRIDKRLPSTDPWSKTVDHIIEIIDGGAELDPSNMQAAHRACNLEKEGKRKTAQAGRRRAWLDDDEGEHMSVQDVAPAQTTSEPVPIICGEP